MDKIGIMVGPRGRGSNMAALVDACRSGVIPAEVRVVVSPTDGTPAVEKARSSGVPVAIVAPGDGYGDRLNAALEGCDWLCLAGFLRLVPPEVLARFPGRALNIHPALLPKYGGKGMYGHHVHEAVIAAGEEESGCTVHRVDDRYDEGEIVLQLRCAVLPGDTAELLATRVLALEHRAYPEALARLIRERSVL